MGLEASCSWPPTHMLATSSSSVLSNEGRRAAESLCARRVSRGSLAQRGRLRSRASRSCALRTVLPSLRGKDSTAKLSLRGAPDLRRSGRRGAVAPVVAELLRSATREIEATCRDTIHAERTTLWVLEGKSQAAAPATPPP